MKTLKRYLYLFHRWLGIVMCVWIALWFATGIIMMYVEYPELTEEERLDMAEVLAPGQVALSPVAAATRAGISPESTRITLSHVAGRPAYRFVAADGAQTSVFADTGELLDEVQAATALATATHSGFMRPESQPVYDRMLEVDQWTVSSVLDPDRPLHRVRMNDAAGTVLYISGTSGQVVRDTVRTERFWNWLGSTIHWIYPWQLRRNVDLWTNILVYLSLTGVIVVFTGGVIGFLRLRVKHPYRGNSITPYRGITKWHHVGGLASLVFVSTFMFSGLMSMLPWGLFDNATSMEAAVARYSTGTSGSGANLAEFDAARDLAAASVKDAARVKEVEWKQINGEPYLVLAESATHKTVKFANGDGGEALLERIDEAALALLPDATLVERVVVQEYDNYYYSHHNRYRPLPALQVAFNDAESSWYYIDLNTGAIVQRLTRTDRVARWLYNGLHSLDFAALFQHRPVWDAVVILLCICGFGFALTSVMLGWRRLAR